MFLYTKKWIVLSFYIINMLVCFSGIFTSDIILECESLFSCMDVVSWVMLMSRKHPCRQRFLD